MFSRNAGFIDPESEQPKLATIHVAIAGTGGDGGELALTLARMGFGHFILADPEKFEKENLNRQAGCYISTLGRNKAEVIAETIKDINPTASVKVFSEGVTEENIHHFLTGADVVVDETEFTQHQIGVLIARAAREKHIPVFMGLNIGFGCLVTSFSAAGLTFEEYLGLSPTLSLDEIGRRTVSLDKWVAILPSYLSQETVQAVASGEVSAPSVAPGVALCSGVLATEIFNYVSGRQQPVTAPHSLWFDAMERKARRITDREAEFQRSLERLATSEKDSKQ